MVVAKDDVTHAKLAKQFPTGRLSASTGQSFGDGLLHGYRPSLKGVIEASLEKSNPTARNFRSARKERQP